MMGNLIQILEEAKAAAIEEGIFTYVYVNNHGSFNSFHFTRENETWEDGMNHLGTFNFNGNWEDA